MIDFILAAAAMTIPLGLPYSATPLPPNALLGLEAHAWGKRDGGLLFRVDGVGTGLAGIYLRFRGSSKIEWMRQRVYFTYHSGTILISFTGASSNVSNDVDPPKPGETCFTVRSIRWTARRLYWRNLDATATQRANPWLDRRLSDDTSCPLALGNLSPVDQARLVIRWGREESFGIAPAPPHIPAIEPR